MHLRNKDILIALSIVLLTVVWMLLPHTVLWVGVLLALPMVFFVPGYMLTEMLTHTRGLNVFHRLTLSLGLSLTLDILGGFLLNMLPIGLRTQSWVALLSCLSLLFALVVFYLRRRVYVSGGEVSVVQSQVVQHEVTQRQEQYQNPSQARRTPTRGVPTIFYSRVRDGFVFALAVTLVVLSLTYATRGVAEQPRLGFTQLWMVPTSQSAQGCTMKIGIRSFENGSVTYHAVMTSNSIQLKSWVAIVLAPNQTWEKSIAVKPPTKNTMFVQVKLYRNDTPTVVYREVHATLSVLSSRQKTFSCEM